MIRKIFISEIVISVVTFLALILTLVYVDRTAESGKRYEASLKTEFMARFAGIRLGDHINTYLDLLELISTEWRNNNINSEKEFAQLTHSLLIKFSNFQAINYIDTNGVIQWVNPLEGNKIVLGLDLHDHPEASETFIMAEKTGRNLASPIINLWQGGVGFAVYFPLYRNGFLDGYLNGVFRVNDMIEPLFTNIIGQNYNLELEEEGRVFLTVFNEDVASDNLIHSRIPIEILNRKWILSLNTGILAKTHFDLFLYNLTIFLSLIFSILLYLAIRRRKEIRKGQKLYHELFQKTNDATLIIKDKKFVDCNEATVTMLRYNTKEELLDTHPSELSPETQPDGRLSLEKAEEMMNMALERGSHRFEWDHLKADGEVFPVEVLLTSITTDTSEDPVIHVVWRDITDRKKAEKLELVLYNISEAAHQAGSLDNLLQVIKTNLHEVLGFQNFYLATYDEDSQLLSFPIYVDEKDKSPEPHTLGTGITEYVMKTGKPVLLCADDVNELEKQDMIKVIGTMPGQWLGSPLILNGKVIGVIALQNYSDQKLYNDQDLEILNYVSEQVVISINHLKSVRDLDIEKSYLNELFTNSPEAVALIDMESKILDINPEFTSLFGYTKKEIVGHNIDYLLTAKDSKERDEAQNNTSAVATGKRVSTDGHRRKKDGSFVPVSILGAPIRYKGGILAIYVIYRDITERKLNEDALKQSERKYRLLSEELNSSNVLKELLLDLITHDLKNPAGVITQALSLIEDESPDKELLDMIRVGSTNLLQTIENATVLSKIVSGDKIEKIHINVAEMVVSLTEEFNSPLQYSGMNVETDIPLSLSIYANPIIKNVFRNYISNAIKYASDRKVIRISAIEEQGRVVIQVADLGKTIPECMSGQIFSRGVRVPGEKREGRGLGLAIAKRIADAHGAEVGLKPDTPSGNIFYLSIQNPE